MNRSKRLVSWFAALSVLLLVLTACGTAAPSTSTPSQNQPAATQPAGPARGGSVNHVLDAEPKTLHPLRWTLGVENAVWRNVFDTVAYLNPTTSAADPMLAEKWETSADGKTITMYFRKGVKFHNGKEMIAEDVIYSIEQAQKGSLHPILAFLKNVEKTEAKDNYTVVLTLKDRDSIFAEGLVNFPIIPKDSDATLAEKPIGTGPFKLKTWERGSYVELERHDAYWQQGKPYLDKVTFRVVPDEQTQMLQLLSGQADVGPATPAYFDRIKSEPKTNLMIIETPQPNSVIYYMLNANKAPLNNAKVRQAINYALDRDKMAASLPGVFIPTSSIVDSRSFYYNPNAPRYYPRDLNKAKQLMAEAGVGPQKIVMDIHGPQWRITLAEIVQQSLKEIGIEVELRNQEISAWVDRVLNKHDYVMALSHLGVTPNPWDTVQNSFGLQRVPATGMDKLVPDWDKLVAEARSLQGDAFTNRLKELQNLALTANTTIHVGAIRRTLTVAARIQDLPPHPQAIAFYHGVWVK